MDGYVNSLVGVFREVHRVLRDDGTAWLNLGDSFSSGGRTTHGTRVGIKQSTNRGSNGCADSPRPPQPTGLKPKDICGIPWRVAFALQADGWYLRSDIIWAKNNPMPESVLDRPTRAHEYMFLLAKSEHYYYDSDAVREEAVSDTIRSSALHRDTVSTNGNGGSAARSPTGYRNRRTVWTLNSEPFFGAHFATFPTKLVEPCVLAGTSEKGCCPRCYHLGNGM